MDRKNCMLIMAIGSAIGGIAGLLAKPQNPKEGGFLGIAAGIIAGAMGAAAYSLIAKDNDGIGYYSKSSPLYDDSGESSCF
ncbi:MAG: hypothetical protein HQL10_01910 [Nitrospirae bacterium]|nr:hypothetical protein [Nitrospirota bacterium]